MIRALHGAFAAGKLVGSAPGEHIDFATGCRVLFEGYVANHAELGRELGAPGAKDAHIVALAFRRWGAAMARRVFGEWAAAIHDEADGSLLLAADALGLMALYHAETDGVVQFSTMLRDLEEGRAFDDAALLLFLAGSEHPGETTPLAGVRRLAQGCAVLVREGIRSVTVHAPAEVVPLRLRDQRDYQQSFRDILSEAVATALPRSGTTWCELSGGLDSSSVVAIAAGVLKVPVAALSYVFGQSPDAEECVWMRPVVNAFGLPWHRLDADRTPAFGSAPRRDGNRPTGNLLTADFLTARAALLKEHGIGTVLTGMCGDAVLIGDSPEPYYLADPVNPLRLWADLRAWTRDGGGARATSFWLLRYVVSPRLKRPNFARERPLPPWIAAAHRDASRSALEKHRAPADMPIGTSYFWDRVLRGAAIAREGQDVGDASFRNPLLYLPLVEYMAAVPWRVKLCPESDRALQREALRGILPEVTRTRRDKRGPAQAIYAGLAASEDWARLLTDKPAIVERGYVDGDKWRQAVRLAQQGFCTSSRDFLRACMVEAWLSA